MANPIKKVMLCCCIRPHSADIKSTLQALIELLKQHTDTVGIDQDTQALLGATPYPVWDLNQPAIRPDLLMVVGGDGCLLRTSHDAVQHQIAVVGINRGRLGFLTDILPEQLEADIKAILQGDYLSEERNLLQVEWYQNQSLTRRVALNDVVIAADGHTPGMIDFSLSIDHEWVYQQRADGLIIATPTGSTAYALSGGGPILHPQSKSLVLVPMFPHTLSNRPIVISDQNSIQVTINPASRGAPQLKCDGDRHAALQPGEAITVRTLPQTLTLIHPRNYNYYETLRSKLGWQKQLHG